jgi:hypothetical protein
MTQLLPVTLPAFAGRQSAAESAATIPAAREVRGSQPKGNPGGTPHG